MSSRAKSDKFKTSLSNYSFLRIIFPAGPYLTGSRCFCCLRIIAAGIGIVNAVTNVATSYRALYEAVSGDPAWAMIYGKQDTLSNVLRQTNFGYGIFNDASNIGAGVIDITEIACLIVGIVEIGVGITKLFKG